MERAREHGADAVVQLTADDDSAGLAARFAESCPGGFDVVVDPLFGVPAAAALRVMSQHGRLVHFGGSAGPESTFDSATLRGRSLAVLGYTNNAVPPQAKASTLRTVLAHAARGELAVAHEVRPLSEVTKAWTDQAAGSADGRIVLAV
jgi:NADPH:quinone reductase-like Zn-dependent oxidoreductase